VSKGYEPPQADAIITTATKEIITHLGPPSLIHTRRR